MSPSDRGRHVALMPWNLASIHYQRARQRRCVQSWSEIWGPTTFVWGWIHFASQVAAFASEGEECPDGG
jgi:hypothetical protein